MNSELFNLWLFFAVMVKVSLLCGFAPGIVMAVLWERFRVVKCGIEQVRDGQLAENLIPSKLKGWATSPSRKVWRQA